MDEQCFALNRYPMEGPEQLLADPNAAMFNDISESFFDDLKSPDPATFNEFFSNFTEFQSIAPMRVATQTHFQPVQAEINREHSETTLKILIEPQAQMQMSSTSSHYVEAPRVLPTLAKKAEPIAVTFDQFQALLNSQTDRSNGISSLLENSTIIGNNIPLKIVPSPSDDSHSSIKSTNDIFPTRTRRKSSHNVIEKRYRSSINERILELKDIVAANDGKIQKSAILRRTIEYLRQLQLTNARLEEENSTLKNILKRLNLTNIPSTTTSHVIEPTSIASSTCSSNGDSTESTLGSSDESISPAPKRAKRSQSKAGMVNGSRLMLCCFMFFILVTNPFDYLLDLLHSSSSNDETFGTQSRIASRTLQTIAIDGRTSENVLKFVLFGFTWKQVISAMLNMAICCVCLIKLFVHGDPIVDREEMNEYFSLKKKADELMFNNQLNEAQRLYRQACEKLYVSIETHCLSYLFSLTWQIIRFVLNLIFVGRWLTFWSGWSKSIDTRDYHRELTMCFLQLWKIEYQCSTSGKNLFHLALLTINTSMNTGKKLDPNLRNEIVLLSALTLKKFRRCASISIPFVLKYFVPAETKDFQMFDVDLFGEFLLEHPLDLFREKTSVASIRQEYRRYFLYKEIQNEFFDADPNEIEAKIDEEFGEDVWWQHCLQLIRCITHEKQHINNVNSTTLLRQGKSTEMTIYQLARFHQIAHERYISSVETIHRILLVLTDDDQLNEPTRQFLLEQLAETSRSLILMSECQWNSSTDNRLDLAIQTLLFDGILSLRLRLLTNAIGKESPSIPHLDDFQQELEHYKILTQAMKLPKQRFYLFESIFRASSGLNPLVTQTLFERAMRPSKTRIGDKEESLPNLDIIAALLLFCHFLPSTVYHYRDLLQRVVSQTAKTKNNFDLQRLQQQCLTLMRQPFLTL